MSESTAYVRDTFGTSPLGFRFPDGKIEEDDYHVLADNDVAFSSSVFPSVRPGRFNNLEQPRTPFRHRPSGVVELPFTVLSDYLPVPVSLSYLKLLGSPFGKLVYERAPRSIVFDFHMHDLTVPPAFEDLPAFYRAVYSRNKHRGFEVLSEFVRTLQSENYSFGLLGDRYEEVAKVLVEQ